MGWEVFQFSLSGIRISLCGQPPTRDEWGKGEGRKNHLRYLRRRSHFLYWGRGIRDVLFFLQSCHALSVDAKILIVVLLRYPSLPVAASHISVYVWSLWFIVTGSQT